MFEMRVIKFLEKLSGNNSASCLPKKNLLSNFMDVQSLRISFSKNNTSYKRKTYSNVFSERQT